MNGFCVSALSFTKAMNRSLLWNVPRECSRSLTLSVSVATDEEREEIYRIRHEVYAQELGQHSECNARQLCDPLDEGNIYLVARVAQVLQGFISVTPPSLGRYSIDKYFARESLPFQVDEGLFELRLLTVSKPHRGRELAMLLMYAAFRWVEANGGNRIVAIGRREILELYLKVGLKQAAQTTRSGLVTYDLVHATVSEIRAASEAFKGLLARLEGRTHWGFSFSFNQPAPCFHGGAFFEAIGARFDALDHKDRIINADVLDAWFPPAPRVTEALRNDLDWLVRTSPPTRCEGLIDSIASARGVNARNILPGAGSSDLIFRSFREWLSPRSHALILDPTYGEYAHVLEQVIGATTDRLTLHRQENYDVHLERFATALRDDYDLVVIVNPNSPTGRHVSRADLEQILRDIPRRTRVWVDETYVEYLGENQSLEQFAARSENVIVCKSMSKVYALSGLRVAYLCAGAHQLEALRAITPPWVVGLPAQLAATIALQEGEYYRARRQETHELRKELESELRHIGWDVTPGVANFLLCHLPESGPTAGQLAQACRRSGLFLRDVGAMGSHLGVRAIRIAVKDVGTNRAMLSRIKEASCEHTR